MNSVGGFGDDFKTLLRSSRKLLSFVADESVDECAIEEEADTYGFSLVSTAPDNGHGMHTNSRRNENILDLFRRDFNWNNPASVTLMSRAYGISDEYCCPLFPAAPLPDECNYLLIKAEQSSMFAQRRFADGMASKEKGNVTDTIKSFSEAIYFDRDYVAAYFERAQQYVQVGKHTDAMSDYKTVLQMQPDHAQAVEQYSALCRRLGVPFGNQSALPQNQYEFGDVVEESARNKLPGVFNSSGAQLSAETKSTNGTTGLISKLQFALRKNPSKLVDDNDSSSSSDGSSSSNSESSHSQDERIKKRKRKEHKERRRKEERSAKKRKSKHKKERSSKHKKRKRDHNDA